MRVNLNIQSSNAWHKHAFDIILDDILSKKVEKLNIVIVDSFVIVFGSFDL